MKKIYFLLNEMSGGGAQRVIFNIVNKLKEDYKITIITLKDDIFFTLPNGIEYIPLSKTKSNFIMILLFPYYVFKFKEILREKKFDGGISSLEISNFINILSNKKAIISFETNIKFFKGIIGFFYKIFIKFLYVKAKKIKVNSEENKYDLANYLGINIKKIEVVYNPIDISKIERLKNEKLEMKLSNNILGKRVFITVGRIIKSKNHIKIINSLNSIYKKIDKNWIYLIIGDGSEKVYLEKLVLNMGLENNIFFLGSQKNVFKYLNISDYFLYASEIEGFPNVLGEAMSCNLPIITSNFISGAKECICGYYNNDKLELPYIGDNGVLLDLKNYESDFLNLYKELEYLKQKKAGFEKFIEVNSILKILF